MSQDVRVRLARAADAAFVAALLRADAETLFAAVPPDARAPLVETQVRGRRAGYARDWPDAVDHVVECDGRPVGRLLVSPVRAGVHVVDLRIAADQRGRGAGTAALRWLIDDANAAGLGVSLRVDPGSPAARLYRRLGFVEVPETGDRLDVLLHHPSR